MKFKKVFSATLVVASVALSACSVKKDTNKDLDDMLAKLNERTKMPDIDQMLLDYLSVVGGQPGKIQIRGEAVHLSEKNEMVLDDRITILQTPGKSLSKVVSAGIGEKIKTFLTYMYDNTTTAGLAESGKYVNLNCGNLDASVVAGLTELSHQEIENSLIIRAKKIFICSDVTLPFGMTSLSADEIIMKDVDTTVYSRAGLDGLSMYANKLTLVGKNKITSQGENTSSLLILGAPDVIVEVHDELLGSGTLDINSIGGNKLDAKASLKVNCKINSVESDKKKSKLSIDLDDQMQGQTINFNNFDIITSLIKNSNGLLNTLSVEVDHRHANQKQVTTQTSETGLSKTDAAYGDATVSVSCRLL